MESILTSIKKLIGIAEDYTHFDTDIITHINTVLMDLTELHVGPSSGFIITDKSAVWTDFVRDPLKLASIRSYTYLRVKLLFDPPPNSSLIASIEKQIAKFEWLINVAAERSESEDSIRYRELLEKYESVVDVYTRSTALDFANNQDVTNIDFYIENVCDNCSQLFRGCSNLKTMVGIYTKETPNVNNMFYGSGIVSIERPFDFRSVTTQSGGGAFNGAYSLVDVRVVPETIKVSQTISSGDLSDESIQSIIEGLAVCTDYVQTLSLHPDVYDRLTTEQLKMATVDKGWIVKPVQNPKNTILETE